MFLSFICKFLLTCTRAVTVGFSHISRILSLRNLTGCSQERSLFVSLPFARQLYADIRWNSDKTKLSQVPDAFHESLFAKLYKIQEKKFFRWRWTLVDVWLLACSFFVSGSVFFFGCKLGAVGFIFLFFDCWLGKVHKSANAALLAVWMTTLMMASGRSWYCVWFVRYSELQFLLLGILEWQVIFIIVTDSLQIIACNLFGETWRLLIFNYDLTFFLVLILLLFSCGANHFYSFFISNISFSFMEFYFIY